MNHKFTKTNENGIRQFAARVDDCGQSHFEVWLPIDALEEFEQWIDSSLARLEDQFAGFVTPDSMKRQIRR